MNSNHHQNTDKQLEIKSLPSKFICSLSSTLRSPINSMLGFSQVMIEGIDGPLTEYQKSDLEIIYKTGYRFLKMINDIIDISKIEAGRMELCCNQIDIERMLDKFIAELIETEWAEDKINDWNIYSIKKSRQKKEIEIKKDVSPQLPIIWADYLRLKQIIHELTANAFQSTDMGTITLAAHHYNDGNIAISVCDTGSGLPDYILKELDKLKMYNSPYAAPRCIGLALSWSLVEMHKGVMEIESQANVGTNITFTLPIDRNRPFFEIKSEDKESFCVYSKSANDGEGRWAGRFCTWQEAVEYKEKQERELETTIYPE